MTTILLIVTVVTFALTGCDKAGDENESQSVTSDETTFLFKKSSKILFSGDIIIETIINAKAN